MKLGNYRLDKDDRKRYVVNYADWLNEGEKVMSSVLGGSVPADNFFVDGYMLDPNGLEIIFYVSGGLGGKSYDVTFTTTTTLAQIKQDYVTFVVTD